MRTLSTERLELIDALVAEASIGDITAGLLEKDEYLTAALQAVLGSVSERKHDVVHAKRVA